MFKYIRKFSLPKSLIKGNNSKSKVKKVISFNTKIVLLWAIFVINLLLILLFKFSNNIFLLTYIFFSIYMLYFFTYDYPKERKRFIKYLNKILNEKKEVYINELEEYRKKNSIKEIKSIILKDEENYDLYHWNIEDSITLLIGKSSANNKVDLDFSNHEYSHLVSRNHGILNKVDNEWYYEDLGSVNGSGIEKSNGKKEKLEAKKPYKIELGDSLYIGFLRLLFA